MKKLFLATALASVLASTAAFAADLPAGWEIVQSDESTVVFANKDAQQSVVAAKVPGEDGVTAEDVAKGLAVKMDCNTEISNTDFGFGVECPKTQTLVFISDSSNGYDILTVKCNGDDCDASTELVGWILASDK